MVKKNKINTNVLIISMLVIIILILCYFIFSNTNTTIHQYYNLNNKDSNHHHHPTTRPNYPYTNLSNDILFNPYVPPLKDDRYLVTSSDIRGTVPINVRTQGVDTDYRQLGILTPVNKSGKKARILPLIGRPLIINRYKWQYYTMETENNFKLPITHHGKSCTNEHGCDELYDNDVIDVEGYNEKFKVSLYDNNTIKYLPFI
jgi:hypothetical protein